jgi:hypothetical protein
MTTRAEQIVYLTEWAARNGMMLKLAGTVGFGRDCTGISADGHYVDTTDVKNALAYNHAAPPDSWWEPEDSYHKHDCLAVLGHGDGPLRQLYDWVKWLDERGFTVTEESRRPSSDIDLLFHGVSLAKLVAPPLTGTAP